MAILLNQILVWISGSFHQNLRHFQSFINTTASLLAISLFIFVKCSKKNILTVKIINALLFILLDADISWCYYVTWGSLKKLLCVKILVSYDEK